MIKGRLTRLETAWRPRRKVTPGYDLDALTEGEVRFILALQTRGGELTPDEAQAVAAIDRKVVKT